MLPSLPHELLIKNSHSRNSGLLRDCQLSSGFRLLFERDRCETAAHVLLSFPVSPYQKFRDPIFLTGSSGFRIRFSLVEFGGKVTAQQASRLLVVVTRSPIIEDAASHRSILSAEHSVGISNHHE